MIELALIKTLLNREFYEQHKGIRCPDKIFTKDVRKIKQTLDAAMREYDGDLNPSDLEALFYAQNQTMTTATKTSYGDLFRKLNNDRHYQGMKLLIMFWVKLFQQVCR